MRKVLVGMLGCVLVAAGLLTAGRTVPAQVAPPAEGGTLPDISLTIPEKTEEQQYLGVEGKGTFRLPAIRAELVIIEVFSMYCPFCQKEAPKVNELYRAIDQDKDLNRKVKLVGLGAGNSRFEVNTFRNAYAIPYPLFADPDFAIHNVLGKVRTPYFIVIKIRKDGSHEVIYSKVGSFGEPQAFLQLINK